MLMIARIIARAGKSGGGLFVIGSKRSKRSPDEQSDIRGFLAWGGPACRCAYAGYLLSFWAPANAPELGIYRAHR
jgi:hypothetical protein